MKSATSQGSISRATQIKEYENQAKFVQQRINEVEAFFGDLCAEIISFTRRTAKLRNNGDEISRLLLDYSVKEKITRSSSTALKRVAEYLATVEDYRHTEVDRLIGKVVNPLATYGDEIKKVRANLKAEHSSRKSELNSRRKLEASKTAEQVKVAELQLHNSIIDVNRNADKLERCMVEFEAKRLKGLKTILKDFIQIEMLWHAKALETLSDSYNVLQTLQEESDLVDFRSTLLRSGSSVWSLSTMPSQMSVQQQHTGQSKALQPSGDHPNQRHSAPVRGHQTHMEDVTSLFSEDEDAEDDDEEEEEDEESRTAVTPVRKLAQSIGQRNEVEDLEDEDQEDDEDDVSELYQHSSSQRGNVQATLKGSQSVVQSPLKSALKSPGRGQKQMA